MPLELTGTDRAAGDPGTLKRNAPSGDRAMIAALRQRLTQIGYNEEGIRSAFNVGVSQDPWSLAAGQPPNDRTPLSTILTLFWSASPVDAGRLGTAVDPLGVSDLQTLGLIEVRDGIAHPLFTPVGLPAGIAPGETTNGHTELHSGSSIFAATK